jgi:FKBP-type peptidyl-prolyl cis-trans isomerase 2
MKTKKLFLHTTSSPFGGWGALLMPMLLLGVACAEKAKDMSADEWEERLIGSYLAINYPDVQPPLRQVEKSSCGYYILAASNPNAVKDNGMEGKFIKFDAVGTLLDGTIFKVTQHSEAEMLMYPTSTLITTHFVPLYDSLGSSAIPAGVADMLQYMAEGDSAAILLPSVCAFGTSGYASSGYTSVSSNTPVIFNIMLREIIPDPIEYEKAQVQKYVDSVNINLTQKFVEVCDTAGIPLGNTLGSIWIRYIDTAPITDTTPLPQTDTVLGLKYAGYFLDGFWLDTNIDSIARQWRQSSYTLQTSYTTTFDHTLGSGNAISAFDVALSRLNKGSVIEIIFTSDYGYGRYGNTAVQPYTPLRFWIYREK